MTAPNPNPPLTNQLDVRADGDVVAVIAEFEQPMQLVAACKKVRDAGYRRWDAHSPFPIHGIDDAIGIRRTKLPWITLGAAMTGFVTAQAMQWYMNAYDYKFLISGKPIWSIPSSMPVTFELSVLFAAFATGLGMLLINGLPRWANPLIRSERFGRVTNDRFFISVDARDPLFREERTGSFLQTLGATHTEEIRMRAKDRLLPPGLMLVAGVLLALLLIPPSLIYNYRVTSSRIPRIHLIQDMDFQPKFKSQKTNPIFADNRAMRPQVYGTIARGMLQADDAFYRGLQTSTPLMALASFQAPADGAAPAAAPGADGAAAPAAGADGAGAAAAGAPAKDPLADLPWVTEFPIELTEANMRRGQQRFNIYCATCHGLAGDGDGLITRRALELEQGTWVNPVSFHAESVKTQPVGRLFHTITNGVRKMPPLGDLIPPEDRWAILLYFRALQRSRTGTMQDVPESVRPALEAS